MNRVLLLEAPTMVESALSRNLSEICEVIRARSQIEATAQAAKLRPQLAVIDADLRGISPPELIAELAYLHPGLRMIVLTGDTTRGNVVQLMRSGAFNVLPHAPSADVISGAVREALADAPGTADGDGAPTPQDGALRIPIGTTLRDAETQLIDATLEHVRGSVPKAARMLGISASTLYRKLDRRDCA